MANVKCSKCGEARVAGPTGKLTKCKACARKRSAAWCAENPDYHLQWNKQRRSTIKNALRIRLATARVRAKKDKYPCTITLVYLLELYERQPYCALTKLPFDLTQFRKTVSIDRIDESAGYVDGHVRLVLWHVNLARGKFGDMALYEIAAALTANRP